MMNKLAIEGMSFNIIKVVHDKPTACATLKDFSLNQKQKKDTHCCQFYYI